MVRQLLANSIYYKTQRKKNSLEESVRFLFLIAPLCEAVLPPAVYNPLAICKTLSSNFCKVLQYQKQNIASGLQIVPGKGIHVQKGHGEPKIPRRLTT